MKCVVLVTLALSALVQAKVLTHPGIPREVQLQEDENMNDYFDSLVVQIHDMVIREGLDPLSLPDKIHELSFKDLLGIRWHGEIELTSGWLQNLSNLKRVGDATISSSHQLKHVTVEIGFPKLMMNYNFRAQIMNIGPEGEILGYIKDLHLLVDIMIDEVTKEVYLQNLDITEAGKIDVTVRSSGLLDLLKNAIADLVTSIFHDTLVGIIQGRLRDTAQKIIDNINQNGSISS